MKTSSTQQVGSISHDAAILEQLRKMGVRIPAKDAWKNSVGWAKDRPLHADAVKAGEEWRDEVNRQSIVEAAANYAGA